MRIAAHTHSLLLICTHPSPAPSPPLPQVRVVSMPVWELFEEQSQEYKDSVLPPEVTARVSVEAGSTFGWQKWVGGKGESIGIDEFGASAPGPLLYEKYGITGERGRRGDRGEGGPACL